MDDLLFVLHDRVDFVRSYFNGLCSSLEAWQIVCYSFSICFLLQYLSVLLRAVNPYTFTRTSFYSLVRSLPWVKRRLEYDSERLRKEVEEDVHQADMIRDFYKFLPERPLLGDDIIAEARQYASMGERKFVNHNDPLSTEQEKTVCSQVFDVFSYSDPHRSDVFPGVRKMEAEIVRMMCSLFHGSSESCGVVAGGGTEAILLASLASRNKAYSLGIVTPEIVAPSTAHPAFDKAAALFNMKIVRVDVGADDKAICNTIKRHINGNTCLLVASAPNHLTGTIDPVEGMSQIALQNDIPLILDCTLGGFILPFMEYCDLSKSMADFRTPGVSAIAIDLHRYGQSNRSCSSLIYRDSSLFKYQCFTNIKWPGGLYSTPTIAGGRDGGAIATSWVTLLLKGKEGYVNACDRIVSTTRTITTLLDSMSSIIKIHGSADICIVSFSTITVDTFAFVDKLSQLGWHVDALVKPVACRIPITLAMCEDSIIQSLITDIKDTIIYIEQNPSFVKRSKQTSLHKLIQTVSDDCILEELSLIRLQAHYSVPSLQERRTLRTLSVDGRKISMTTNNESVKSFKLTN